LSLSAILDAIHSAGKAQVQEIEKSRDLRIQEIMDHAGVDVEKIGKEAEVAAVAPAFGERAKIIHHARLKTLHIIGDVRESMVDTALDQAKGRLSGIRTDTAYPEVLRCLTKEAIAELQQSLKETWEFHLEADPRDRELLECILSDEELNTSVNYTLDVWGGLIAKSQDNRVVVINTLEARLERANPFLRRYLAAFFETEQQMTEEKWMA